MPLGVPVIQNTLVIRVETDYFMCQVCSLPRQQDNIGAQATEAEFVDSQGCVVIADSIIPGNPAEDLYSQINQPVHTQNPGFVQSFFDVGSIFFSGMVGDRPD